MQVIIITIYLIILYFIRNQTKNDKNANKSYKNFKYNLHLDGSDNLVQVRQNILNEYNEIQWEDTNEQEYAYNIRYIDANGNIMTKEQYDTAISNGELTYIAAFVGCTFTIVANYRNENLEKMYNIL